MAVGAIGSHPQPDPPLALTPCPDSLAGVQRAMGYRSTRQRVRGAADALEQQHQVLVDAPGLHGYGGHQQAAAVARPRATCRG